MAGHCAYNALHVKDDTFGNKHSLDTKQELALQDVASTSVVASSPYFEIIDGVLHRKKLEKGNTNYREVLDLDRQVNVISTFHLKGRRHHTLEDTYRLVAENYWWEGMYFHIREYVLGCQECQVQKERCKQACPEPCVSRKLATHGNSVLHKLRGQQKAGLFCDITLKTGSRSFPAHRAVLAAVSEYFQEMFTEMDCSPGRHADIDLTGFSEELFLPLLEFSYSSTLSVRADSLGEVSALARHFRMWAAVEACRALQSERKAGRARGRPASLDLTDTRQEQYAGLAASHKRRSFTRAVEPVEAGQKRPLPQDRILNVCNDLPEAPRLGGPSTRSRLGVNGLSSVHVHRSPSRRLKLMDFKSLSGKPKESRASQPSSSLPAPGAFRRPVHVMHSGTSLPKLCSSGPGPLRRLAAPSGEPRLSLAEVELGQAPGSGVGLVKEEPVAEEVSSSNVQEKYRLLSVLGLQRKSLLPHPVQPTSWQQKQRLRKPKVLNYAQTTPRASRPAPPTCFSGDSGNASAFRSRPIKVEASESTAVEETGLKRRRRGSGMSLTSRMPLPHRRELRRSIRIRDAPLQSLPRLRTRKVEPRLRTLRRKPIRVKREPSTPVISPPALSMCSSQACHPRERSLSSRARCPLELLLVGVGRRTGGNAQLGSPAKLEGCAPLWREAIKHEPSDPVPVTAPVALTTELGKRRSKPPMKLLDPGFLFEFCRPPGLKREAESMDICLTRSTKQLHPRGGASGPQRKERGMNTSHRPNLACSGTAKVRAYLPKKRHKLLESTRRACWKGRAPVTSHTCVHCRAKYRNCDTLIMHQIRHIEGKHWPCPLCSKTFFRQKNVQSHIRTHDQKLYKCRDCISAA